MFNKKARKIEELRASLNKAIERENRYYTGWIKEKQRHSELVDDVKYLETELDILNEKYKGLEKRYELVCRARDYWSTVFHEEANKVRDLEDKVETLDVTNDGWIKSFNQEHKKVHDLEKKLKKAEEEREDAVILKNNYFDWVCQEKQIKANLEVKIKELETALEEKVEIAKKEQDYWYGQYQIMASRASAYQSIAEKFMAVYEDGDVDDTHIIHNGKVYTIVGIKHIVDNLGDTLDVRAELIDPEKAEEKKIGFKLEEKEPVIKEDDE